MTLSLGIPWFEGIGGRKIKGLGEGSSGGKEVLVANLHSQGTSLDGLQLPDAFVVEKIEKNETIEQSLNELCTKLVGFARGSLRNDDNLRKYYGAWHDNRYLYLAFEYCPHELFTAIEQGRFFQTSEGRKAVARQMLATIDNLHRNGFVHPHLRLEDFQVSENGNVKLSGVVSISVPLVVDQITKAANVLQVGRVIFAIIFGTHAPKVVRAPSISGTHTSRAEEFFSQLLHPDPHDRLSIASALVHPWLLPDIIVAPAVPSFSERAEAWKIDDSAEIPSSSDSAETSKMDDSTEVPSSSDSIETWKFDESAELSQR
jgi:serine/threonine protein kinase